MVSPTFLAPHLDLVQRIIVTSLGLRDAQVGHDRAPFRPVWGGAAVARDGHQMGDLVGHRLGEELGAVASGDIQVVTQYRRISWRPDRLSGGLTAQVESNLRIRGCAGMPGARRCRQLQQLLGPLGDVLP